MGEKSILRLVLNVASFNRWITILVDVRMKLPHLSFKKSTSWEWIATCNLEEMSASEIKEKPNERERNAHELYVEVREKQWGQERMRDCANLH